MTITSPAIILKVNRMSNATDGKGITSMAMIAKITMGIAIPFASVKLSDCRKSDTNAPFILSLIYQYVMNKLKINLRIKFSLEVIKAIYVPE